LPIGDYHGSRSLRRGPRLVHEVKVLNQGRCTNLFIHDKNVTHVKLTFT
jgi:hypothetical protein